MNLPSNTAATEAGPDASSPQPTLVFDQNGDLRLCVDKDQNKQDMLVDSRALCRASPVFRKMLGGSFAEKKPNIGEWRVCLPDDKSGPFSILMDITHGLFERSPAEPSVEQLYEITVLTDKYDMTRVLRPIAANWLKEVKYDMLHQPLENRGKALFIAWELGSLDLFRSLADSIADDAIVDTDGQLAHETMGPLSILAGISSLEIMDTIEKRRDGKLAIILRDCYALTRVLVGGTAECTCPRLSPSRRHNSFNSDSYQQQVLGKLYQDAFSNDISSLFHPQHPQLDFTRSVAVYLKSLKKVEDSMSQQLPCNPLKRTMELMKVRTTRPRMALEEWQAKHLTAQGQKTSFPVKRTNPRKNRPLEFDELTSSDDSD